MNAIAGAAAFILSVTLSAGLLFLVEPMVAKMLLPLFGGSAAVWSVAIVFFQGALLIGYLYAHALVRWLSPRAAAGIHLAILGAGLLLLPIRVSSSEVTTQPSLAVLLALLAAIGLPFTALAANAPLLQAFYARTRLPGAADPYPLYAASNIGSLVALLSYPLLIEPAAALSTQTRWWAFCYAALILAIALAVWLGKPVSVLREAGQWRDRRWPMWVGLALVPSAALVAVTAHISVDVAAAPLLWVAPLALYLATFVVAFSGRGKGMFGAARWLMPLGLIAVAAVQGFNIRFGLLADIGLHLTVFFLVALVFHGALAARVPPPAALTAFYVAMSAGGLVGGIAAALVAPAIFTFVAEYPLILIAAAFAAPWRFVIAPLVAGLLILPGILAPSSQEKITRRSFYGVHTMEVTQNGQFRVLRHGQEIHGAVRLRNADGTMPNGPPKPLTYYHEEGAISWAIDAARARKGGPIRIGAVGLGTGSMACLREAGDTIDFYEIDPEVIRIAQEPKLFGFLAGCRPESLRVIEGDARKTLARDAQPYDVLILDAFSSDAIPMHLITREAMEVYLGRLVPGGMLILHISNNHLRLNEVVAATARSLQLTIRIYDEYEAADAPALVFQPTVAVMARNAADLGELATSSDWQRPAREDGTRPWTDDYSNLLQAIIAKVRED